MLIFNMSRSVICPLVVGQDYRKRVRELEDLTTVPTYSQSNIGRRPRSLGAADLAAERNLTFQNLRSCHSQNLLRTRFWAVHRPSL